MSPRLLAQAWLASAFILLPAHGATQVPVPAFPGLPVKSYLLVDYHSGRELASKDANLPLSPASLTKIMTVYVAGQYLENTASMDDEATISEKAWRTGGSKMFIEVGKQVSLEDLLRGVVIQSGNDASIALAEHLAGTEENFSAEMNAAAQRLGMEDTQFLNATGLGASGHFTTARDLAVLSVALIRDFPDLYAMHAEREFTYNRISQKNRNRLLWQEEDVDGIKTGHTEAAGYCLVVSAERDGMRLISVVMGADSERAREQASRALLSYGFNNYETRRVLGVGEPALKAERVWKGYRDEVPVGTMQDVYVTVPRGTPALELRVSISGPLIAPIAAGQQVGVLELIGASDGPREFPLVALEMVDQGSLLSRWYDSVLLQFKH